MNNPYESPKAKLEDVYKPPSKKFVHLSFWIGHISLLIYVFGGTATTIESNEISWLPIALLFLGIGSLFWYFFAIGSYANKLGRNGITWGGLSFFFSPIGVWVSYIASFFVGPKVKNSKS